MNEGRRSDDGVWHSVSAEGLIHSIEFTCTTMQFGRRDVPNVTNACILTVTVMHAQACLRRRSFAP